jgi:DNA-directed RNA polymerase subunit beta'
MNTPNCRQDYGARHQEVMIATVFNCKSKVGFCRKCYGMDLTTLNPVIRRSGRTIARIPSAPGTQLTMLTFHTGGVAAPTYHTGPAAVENFRARKPKASRSSSR